MVAKRLSNGGSPAAVQQQELDDLDELLNEELRVPEFAAAYKDATAREEMLRDLLEARRAAGLTQIEVAERMGTTQSAVSELEGGVGDPRLTTLQRYARAVGRRLETRVSV